MEQKCYAEGLKKLKAAMIDAAILRAEETIDNDHEDVDIIDNFDVYMYKIFEKFPRDVDPSGTPLSPGFPEYCLGSGRSELFEVCCDECDHFGKCFPEVEDELEDLIDLIAHHRAMEEHEKNPVTYTSEDVKQMLTVNPCGDPK